MVVAVSKLAKHGAEMLDQTWKNVSHFWRSLVVMKICLVRGRACLLCSISRSFVLNVSNVDRPSDVTAAMLDDRNMLAVMLFVGYCRVSK